MQIEVSMLFSAMITIIFIIGCLVGFLSRKEDHYFMYTEHDMRVCERRSFNDGYNCAVDEFGGKEENV